MCSLHESNTQRKHEQLKHINTYTVAESSWKWINHSRNMQNVINRCKYSPADRTENSFARQINLKPFISERVIALGICTMYRRPRNPEVKSRPPNTSHPVARETYYDGWSSFACSNRLYEKETKRDLAHKILCTVDLLVTRRLLYHFISRNELFWRTLNRWMNAQIMLGTAIAPKAQAMRERIINCHLWILMAMQRANCKIIVHYCLTNNKILKFFWFIFGSLSFEIRSSAQPTPLWNVNWVRVRFLLKIQLKHFPTSGGSSRRSPIDISSIYVAFAKLPSLRISHLILRQLDLVRRIDSTSFLM